MRIACLLLASLVITASMGCGGVSLPAATPSGPPNQPPTAQLIPAISMAAPSSAHAGSAAVSITVSGSGFDSTSRVFWGGTELTTMLISNTQLSSQLSSDLIRNVTIGFLTVRNKYSTGITISAERDFPVLTTSGTGTIDGVISQSETASAGNGISLLPALGKYGRYSVFASTSTNLGPLVSGKYFQVFLKDTCRAVLGACVPTVKLLSTSTNGSEGDGDSVFLSSSASLIAMTRDARYVSYRTKATNLTSPASNGKDQIVLRETCVDLTACTPQTTPISLSNLGSWGDNISRDPAISGDGRYVAFSSVASNFGSTIPLGRFQIYLRDTCLGVVSSCAPTTTLVSVGSSGIAGDGDSYGTTISASGRFIGFLSSSTQLISHSAGGVNAYLRDTCLGAASCTPSTTLLSKSPAFPDGLGVSSTISMDSSGRYVAFIANALTNGIPNGSGGVNIADTCAAVSGPCSSLLRSIPQPASSANYAPVLSKDASVILFLSQPIDQTGTPLSYIDAYVARTCLIASCASQPLDLNRTPTGNAQTGNSADSALSPDGHTAALSSGAFNLVTPSSVASPQIYSSTTSF